MDEWGRVHWRHILTQHQVCVDVEWTICVHDGVVGSRHGRLAVGGLNWESGRTMGGKAHARSRPWSDWFACSFTERSAATILCYAPGWRDCFGSNAGVAPCSLAVRLRDSCERRGEGIGRRGEGERDSSTSEDGLRLGRRPWCCTAVLSLLRV